MRLHNILTEEQEAAGLTLHDDEDMVYLHHRDMVVAVWSIKGVTQTAIQAEAQSLLDKWALWDKMAVSPELQDQNV